MRYKQSGFFEEVTLIINLRLSPMKKSPFYPSLRFKCVNCKEHIWSIRISLRSRAAGIFQGDIVIWFWDNFSIRPGIPAASPFEKRGWGSFFLKSPALLRTYVLGWQSWRLRTVLLKGDKVPPITRSPPPHQLPAQMSIMPHRSKRTTFILA